MKVSVCMCTYNGESFIWEQLDSIYYQTRQIDELIICDDKSKDRTVEIISEYIQKKKLEEKWRLYINETNKGYPGNFYYAMSLCTGDIVFLADQDDIWKENKLQIMCDVLEQKKDIQVLACKFGLIDAEGKNIHTFMAPTKSNDSMQLKNLTPADIFYKYETSGMALAYRNEWYRQRKVRNSMVPHDFLICSMAAEENGLAQIDAELAYHRRHANNAAKEEYRLKVLLNKERKLKEISEYMRNLQSLKEESYLKAPEAQRQLEVKLKSMEERYQALNSGSRRQVLQNAIRNREVTRPATVICDLLIAGQKCSNPNRVG